MTAVRGAPKQKQADQDEYIRRAMKNAVHAAVRDRMVELAAISEHADQKIVLAGLPGQLGPRRSNPSQCRITALQQQNPVLEDLSG